MEMPKYSYERRRKFPSMNPDPKVCGLLRAARKNLGWTLKQSAARLGLSFSAMASAEHCWYKLAKQTEARLIAIYLLEFAQRGGYEVEADLQISIEELRTVLARAIVAHKTGSLVLAARGTDGAADGLVDSVIASAVADEFVPSKLRALLLGVSL
jgi:hypothetical protein